MVVSAPSRRLGAQASSGTRLSEMGLERLFARIAAASAIP